MKVTTKIDQNRTDYLVTLINDGFVHIGTIWDKYDIYYNPATGEAQEIDFPNLTMEYEIRKGRMSYSLK